MNYTIKPLRAEYEGFLWDLLYQDIFEAREESPAHRSMDDLPLLKRYMQHWGEREGDFGLLALDENNQPLGAVWVRVFDDKHKGWGYVDNSTPELNIALRQDYRNKGIGTQMLVKLIEELKGKYAQLSLSVNPHNPSVRLYERFGFEKYEDARPAITMVKKL